MSREMVLLRQATGASSVQNFESMLSAFSAANSISAGAFNTPTAIEYIANSVNFKNIKFAANELPVVQEKLKTMGYALTQNGEATSLKVQATP